MANILIEATPEPRTFPFDVAPYAGGILDKTALPRGRITFQILKTVIPAKIATNTTSINVENVMPANYAYVVEFATIQVNFPTSTSDAANFSANGIMQVRLGDALGTRRAGLFSRGISPAELNAGSSQIWHPENYFPTPIFNLLGATPIVNLEVFDVDAGATVVGELNTVVSVLQFDLEQIFNVAVNFPLPVSVR